MWSGATVKLRLVGELDIATVPLLHHALTAVLSERPHRLCLDLTHLTFCDKAGLQALQHLTDTIYTAHVTLHLHGLHPNIQRTLTGLQTTPPWPPTSFPKRS
ncbi:STAS domain-containing protein [Streptomyces djakartensis]|uniref:STAS domain-containing protein n=1 Tax=Streptomyces djakartensis TaxID=68193 RepID=UPI0034DE6125